MQGTDAYLTALRGREIKAISLQQPWATLLAYGWLFPGELKQIETRGWKTGYRGPLAIHAAAKIKEDSRYATDHSPAIQAALRRLGVEQLEQLPLGRVLAIGELEDCRRVVHPSVTPGPQEMHPPLAPEYFFGDYSVNRYGWVFREMHVLPKPVPASGMLAVWAFTLP